MAIIHLQSLQVLLLNSFDAYSVQTVVILPYPSLLFQDQSDYRLNTLKQALKLTFIWAI